MALSGNSTLAHCLQLLCIALLATAVQAQDDAEIPPADEWYKSEYAPLYGDKPWDHAEELAQYFTAKVRVHNGTSESVDALPWMTDALQEWKIQGWVRSEIADIEFDQINATTAAFKTKWRDYYNGGNVGYECTWYLAVYDGSNWKISDVAGITCTEHGL